jgi:hypothetical protein
MAKLTLKVWTQPWLAIVLSFCLVCSVACRAKDSSPTPEETTRQLLERVRELEAKVQQLEEREAAMASATEPLADVKTPPTPTLAPVAAPVPAPTAAPAPQESAVNEVAERLKLLYFGDVGYQTGHYYGPTSTFEFGEFNMFATARLTDHISVLADVLLTSNPDNSVDIDMERLLIKYRQSDYFTASIGRIHTAIGYYNTAFDRGDYFQTATTRPTLFEFDDQGGFLPLQDLGIVLNGNLPSGKLGLRYVFEVTNGRDWGANVEPAQNNTDMNNSKAVNFGLSMKPDKPHGLIVGFSIRHDYLSDVLALHVSELLPVVYAVYVTPKFEWLNEVAYITHKLPSGAAFHTTGFYSLVSRAFGHYRPYFRYDYVNTPVNDPIYDNPAVFPPVERVNGPTAGVRWDFTPYTAIKLQYTREDARGETTTNGGNAQFDFTF